MPIVITIPDFEFSGFYYPELLEDLIQFLRIDVPEITDESPEEPFIQLLRVNALMGHLTNVLLDQVANERFLPTAQLRASVAAQLKLIDFNLSEAGPASADLLVQLSQIFTASTLLVPTLAKFATEATAALPAIVYEALAAVAIHRTDRVGWVLSYNKTADTYTDNTAEAITSSGSFSPSWGPAVGDALYIGHPDILWDTTRFLIAVGAIGIGAGVWEYFDGNFDDGAPDSVVNDGLHLNFQLNELLGAENMTGTIVRVRSTITGGYEDRPVSWNGSSNSIQTSAFLGQAIPSVNASDYVVGSDWQIIPGQVDETGQLSQTGQQDLSYTIPQTVAANWRPTAVDGLVGYWLRFRLTSIVGSPVAPSITEVLIDAGSQYAVFSAVQGESQSDNPLGSSAGLPDQAFTLLQSPVIDDATLRVFVTEDVESEWTRVPDFLASISIDRHFTVSFDDNGNATIGFGDGTNGKIPASGYNNIRAIYRTMDDVNGNVGQNTITVNRSGVPYINTVTNPRPANGYTIKEGSTPQDLARVKISGPASLRTRQRAVSADDVQELAASFVSSDGTRPVARALAVEEAYGPKTVGLFVAGPGGSPLSTAQLAELQIYFNGDPTTNVKGVLVLNHQAVVSNYVQHAIDVTATVSGGNLTAILTALTALLSPVAVEDDGTTYVWQFGDEIPSSRINAEIFKTGGVRKVLITVPAGNVELAQRELPIVGTLTINLVP